MTVEELLLSIEIGEDFNYDKIRNDSRRAVLNVSNKGRTRFCKIVLDKQAKTYTAIPEKGTSHVIRQFDKHREVMAYAENWCSDQ